MAPAPCLCCAGKSGDTSAILGIRAEVGGVLEDIKARAVVLASGGFEANLEWRARYLGQAGTWRRPRGTRFNTGDGIRAGAPDIGAATLRPVASGCHSCAWERYAGDFGSLIESASQRLPPRSYLYGIVVNSEGKRFLDEENADFRNFTYAKYGRIILH